MTPWLAIVGVGVDGLESLSATARALVGSAEVLVGGERHQAMVPSASAERLIWGGSLGTTIDAIAAHRGRRVVVLASGDPMWCGVGATLARRFDPAEMTVLPHIGAFSLAAARMVWSLADVETITLHSRPLARLHLFVQPNARLLALSRDGDTPAEVAALLTGRGFGPSAITVLECLGGPNERRIDGVAESWNCPRTADLNTLAIECRPGPKARLLPCAPGLPDEAFESDGQLTKREVRAMTVAALAPLPGQILWDVGAGSGSIAIEWLRCVPWRRVGGHEARAFAIERDPERCGLIARNAAALGVPQLEVVPGEAPDVFAGLPTKPDTIFLGGGVARRGLLEACWQALREGGRLVANTVTLEGETRLIKFRRRCGGELTRIAVSRAGSVGRLTAFRALMGVTQWTAIKP